MASHVRQVDDRGGCAGSRLLLAPERRGPVWRVVLQGLPAEDGHRLPEARSAVDDDGVDERRFPDPIGRDHQPLEPGVAHPLGDRQHAAAGPYAAPEGELAEHGEALQALERDLPARREHATGDREVEAGAGLAEGRRRQVDRHALVREREAGVVDRGPHALPGLAHRLVAEPDDGEARQARAEVDLDGDAARLQAGEGEGADVGDHWRDARPGLRHERRRGCRGTRAADARKCAVGQAAEIVREGVAKPRRRCAESVQERVVP